MRVALFSRNARCADAIGQQLAAKLAYFQQLGAEVRLFLSEGHSLRPEAATVRPVVDTARKIWGDANQQEYLRSCDLIIAEFGAAYDLIELLPALAGQGPRIVVDYRGVTPVDLGDSSLRDELEAAARQRVMLWCADAVLVQSRFAASELHDATGIPLQRIHVIPCWMATPGKPDDALVTRLRHEHGLVDKNLALFVGRLARNKQPEKLIEALARIDGLHGVFVGCQHDTYQEQLKHCQSLAQRLGISKRVHFVGSADEAQLEAWYRATDVLVLPSRHECFGMPVVEAMMRGTPVVTSDAGSLPEVLGHTGLSAGVDNVDELTIQIRRIVAPSVISTNRRVALVTHRFGNGFAGGAEKSLRLMAESLQQHGYTVEVFTTCNEHDSRWTNSLKSGSRMEHGFVTHRFPIDEYDAEKLGHAYESIRLNNGNVSEDIQQQYLSNSLGSRPLIEALSKRQHEFSAIITGPYLFKLAYEVVCALGERVLLAPCFHEEPLAYLKVFQHAYRQTGGLLFHTDTEAVLASEQLKITHPRHAIIGTVLPEQAFQGDASVGQRRIGSPYLVYCGRYCPEKGLEKLLDCMHDYSAQGASKLKLVCIGQGPMALPKRPWLFDLGFVDEDTKRDMIAGALALVNLSRNESLSIVALEAWALGVPVIADRACSVLHAQIERAQGGVCVSDAEDFGRVVDSWMQMPATAHSLGNAGREFVAREYASPDLFYSRLERIIESMQKPLGEVARTRGYERIARYSAAAWNERLSTILEQVQTAELSEASPDIVVKPLQRKLTCTRETGSEMVTLRIINQGNTFLAVTGPAKAVLRLQLRSATKRKTPVVQVPLPKSLPMGMEYLVVAGFDVPKDTGKYQLRVRLVSAGRTLARCTVALEVTDRGKMENTRRNSMASMGGALQLARSNLSEAKRLEQLPEDYVDVTEGALAGLKRSLKRKLLNNFRKAYVDVAFRRQSALNEKLIAAMSLLLETLSAQENGTVVADLQRRVLKLEKKVKRERRLRRQLQDQLKEVPSSDVSLMERE